MINLLIYFIIYLFMHCTNHLLFVHQFLLLLIFPSTYLSLYLSDNIYYKLSLWVPLHRCKLSVYHIQFDTISIYYCTGTIDDLLRLYLETEGTRIRFSKNLNGHHQSLMLLVAYYRGMVWLTVINWMHKMSYCCRRKGR